MAKFFGQTFTSEVDAIEAFKKSLKTQPHPTDPTQPGVYVVEEENYTALMTNHTNTDRALKEALAAVATAKQSYEALQTQLTESNKALEEAKSRATDDGKKKTDALQQVLDKVAGLEKTISDQQAAIETEKQRVIAAQQVVTVNEAVLKAMTTAKFKDEEIKDAAGYAEQFTVVEGKVVHKNNPLTEPAAYFAEYAKAKPYLIKSGESGDLKGSGGGSGADDTPLDKKSNRDLILTDLQGLMGQG